MLLLHQGLRQGGLRRSTTSSSSFFSLFGSSIRTRLSSTNLSSYQHQTQVFPWRHDASLPDRVLQHNDFSGAFNPTARDPPILRKLIAARELNISAWDVLPIPFYKHDWEIQLALNFAVAFEFAIGELLGTVFRGMCYYISYLFCHYMMYMLCSRYSQSKLYLVLSMTMSLILLFNPFCLFYVKKHPLQMPMVLLQSIRQRIAAAAV